MEFQQNIKAYHCNDIERCTRFVTESDYLIISEDTNDKWLGTGMYFWDNYGNAQYWKSEKERKDNEKEYTIVTAHIFIDNILDLTDENGRKIFGALWAAFSSKYSRRNARLGKKIDYVLKDVDSIYGWTGVKANAIYKGTEDELFAGENLPHITSRTKTIYMIKNATNVVNREFWEG